MAGDTNSGHVRLEVWWSELFGLDLTSHSAFSAVFGKLGGLEGRFVCLFFPLFLLRKDPETRCLGKTINN